MEGRILIFLFGELAFIAVLTWMILHYREARARRLSDERLRILERLGNPREIGELFQAEGGAKLLSLLQPPAPPPLRGIIRLVVVAILLLFTGFACHLISRLGLEGLTPPFRVLAILLEMIGLGALVAAAAAGGLLKALPPRWKRPVAPLTEAREE